MKKTIEILNKINTAKTEMKVLKDNGELDKAMNKVTEIENLKKEFKIEQIAEEEILNKVPDDLDNKNKDAAKPEMLKVYNKALRGLDLNEVENAMIEAPGDANGGEFLVPIEQIQRIIQFKNSLISLKTKCDVIPVSSPKGNMPVEFDTQDGLKTQKEMADINPSDIKFSNIDFAIEDYSDLVFVSNQFFNDSAYDISGIINKRFAKKAVITENAQIFNVLNQCTQLSGKDNMAINKALNVSLDPEVALQSEILTDQDGFNYLDSLTDKVGRPLLTESLAVPGAKEYKGKVITTVKNGAFEKTDGTIKFYVGMVEESVAFFDRQEITIAMSTDFAFNKRAKAFLVAERIDTKLKNPNGVIQVTITPAKAALPAA